jgi:hypothetical protein
MRSLIALPLGALLVVTGALIGSSDIGTAAYVRATTSGSMAQAPAQQQPGEPPAISSRRTINLTEEDRHTIREIVLKDLKVQKESDAIKAAIGDPAPQGVTTHEFPALMTSKIPALKAHTYFVRGEEIVVVDSRAGKIADIVK